MNRAIVLLLLLLLSAQALANENRCDVWKKLHRSSRYLIEMFRREPHPAGLKALEARWKAIEAMKEQYPWLPSRRKLRRTETWQEIQKLRMSMSSTASGQNENEDAAIAARNFEEADALVRKWVGQGAPITLRRIKRLHAVLGKDLKNNGQPAGAFRTIDLMNSNNSKLLYPKVKDVEPMMEEFVRWYEKSKDALHPIDLAGRAHQRLVSIHPFPDANGRLCRMVMDWILQNNGYPPTVYFDRLSSYSTVYLQRPPEDNYGPVRAADVATLGVEQAYQMMRLGLEP
jgi:Fic family protein